MSLTHFSPQQVHDKHVTTHSGVPIGCVCNSDIPVTFKAGGGLFQAVGGLRGWSWKISIDSRLPVKSDMCSWSSQIG